MPNELSRLQKRWQHTLPEKEGDWLWINQWSCGCCLINTNIAWVMKKKNMPEGPCYEYKSADGTDWCIAWGRVEPYFHPDGTPQITAWQRLEFPFVSDE